MQESRLAYLFDRYINRECSAREKAELFALLEAEDYDGELKNLLDKMIDKTPAELKLPETVGNKMIQSIIVNGPVVEPAAYSLKTKTTVRTVWLSIAAASVVLLGFISYFLLSPGTIAKDTSNSAGVLPNNWLRINTAVSESRNIQLPDGTQVWLSPSSRLEYPPAFDASTREVKLSGEAFFEVTSNAQQPFIIHSDNIQTKVLGTSFNIQAYENQEEIAVTVVTGRVNVTNTARVEDVELIANERAVFHRNTTKLIKESAAEADAPNMLKRKDGMFVYKNERLQKLIDDLEEYFGINIIVAQPMKDCKVNANFYLTDNLDAILEPVAIMVNAEFHKSDKELTISGKGCP